VEHLDKKKWEQENVLRLVKKSRKGVLRVVFSRFGLMALLLILELVLLWMMWRWFNNDFEWFAAVQGVFTVLMFFHLFNSDMDATGKLTWMFLLAGIPIPARIFLWVTGKGVGIFFLVWIFFPILLSLGIKILILVVLSFFVCVLPRWTERWTEE